MLLLFWFIWERGTKPSNQRKWLQRKYLEVILGNRRALLEILNGDFPGGAVVKNPPALAGSIPGRTRVRSLVQEDPTCRGATKPASHNYLACALEPANHNYWAHVPQLLSLCSRARKSQLLSPRATTTEAHAPRAHAPQQEKPPQWEDCAPQRRVAPARRN